MILSYIHWGVDPVIFTLGNFPVRYYGLLFVTGLFLSYMILIWLFKKENKPQVDLDRFVIYAMVGILVGARLGHCLFYEPGYFLHHPLQIFLPVSNIPGEGMKFIGYQGLASHGGLLGLAVAIIIYSRKTGYKIIDLMDLCAIVAPIGGAFIRIGNLMNSEIVGISTIKPWAFVFTSLGKVPRHPAQLYEVISFIIIFIIIITLYKRMRDKLQSGFIFGLSFSLAFIARFFIEFVKENQVPFENYLPLNMGQILSLPFILFGWGIMFYSFRKGKKVSLH